MSPKQTETVSETMAAAAGATTTTTTPISVPAPPTVTATVPVATAVAADPSALLLNGIVWNVRDAPKTKALVPDGVGGTRKLTSTEWKQLLPENIRTQKILRIAIVAINQKTIVSVDISMPNTYGELLSSIYEKLNNYVRAGDKPVASTVIETFVTGDQQADMLSRLDKNKFKYNELLGNVTQWQHASVADSYYGIVSLQLHLTPAPVKPEISPILT